MSRYVDAVHRRLPMPLTERLHGLVASLSTRHIHRMEDAEVARLRASSLPVSARVVTIIPTYRRNRPLLAAVRSALSQKVPDHRVLVVDDGGGEADLSSLDPDQQARVTAVQLRANIGVAGSVRNVGIRLSQSTYVAFLDDDNTWAPGHLAAALDALREADVAYAAVCRVRADGSTLDVLDRSFSLRSLWFENYVDTSAIVTRRRNDLHFSRLPRTIRGSRRMEDWEFARRSARAGLVVAPTGAATVRYLMNPESYYSGLTDRTPTAISR